MRILFDQGTPAPLRQEPSEHQVTTAYELGWSRLSNGELLAAAEQEGFEVLLTTDTNLTHQLDLSGRSLAIVVLRTTSWPRIRRGLPAVVEAVSKAGPGTYREVSFP